jgi:hypothetical protein
MQRASYGSLLCTVFLEIMAQPRIVTQPNCYSREFVSAVIEMAEQCWDYNSSNFNATQLCLNLFALTTHFLTGT